jgi:hypothetical protein
MVGNAGQIEMTKPPNLNTILDVEEYSIKDDEALVRLSKSESPNLSKFSQLNYSRSCHICPVKFKELHFFYDQLCPKCATFNYNKRSYDTNMKGRVCLVTGARVKVCSISARTESQVSSITIR